MTSLLIGKQAPYFRAKAVIKGEIIEGFSLKDLMGKYVVFFFYPLDFTFVCPTELHAFQEYASFFEERDACVVGCSVDSVNAHYQWINTPKYKGGIAGVNYPLVSDLNKTISRDYHVLNEEEGIAYRGLVILDRSGIVRHQLINDLPIGRSVDEVLRTLDALIYHEKHGEVCPANWKTGKETMKPDQQGLEVYFSKSR